MSNTYAFDLTDDQLDFEIAETYRWFAKKAPGVKVKEHGRLAKLWAEFDRRRKHERASAE